MNDKSSSFSTIIADLKKTENYEHRNINYTRQEIEKALELITPIFLTGKKVAVTIPQLSKVLSITGLCASIDSDQLGSVMEEIRTHFWMNGLVYFNLIPAPTESDRT